MKYVIGMILGGLLVAGTLLAPVQASTAPALVAMEALSAQVGGTWTAAQADSSLDEIASKITQNRQLAIQGQSAITRSDNELGALTSDYASLVSAINADAVANPEDASKVARKARLAEYISEFQALKIEVAAMRAALEAL